MKKNPESQEIAATLVEIFGSISAVSAVVGASVSQVKYWVDGRTSMSAAAMNYGKAIVEKCRLRRLAIVRAVRSNYPPARSLPYDITIAKTEVSDGVARTVGRTIHAIDPDDLETFVASFVIDTISHEIVPEFTRFDEDPDRIYFSRRNDESFEIVTFYATDPQQRFHVDRHVLELFNEGEDHAVVS